MYEYRDFDRYYQFGYKIVGPFLMGFLLWLKGNIEKKDYKKLFFFSRDGYLIHKGFELLFSEAGWGREYVYFSRKSIRQALLYSCRTYEESLAFLSKERFVSYANLLGYWGFSEQEIQEIAKNTNTDYNKQFSFSRIINEKELKDVYYELKPMIDKRSLDQAELLLCYLNQIGMTGSCAIIDIGWNGSLQYYLELFSEKKLYKLSIDGYYVGSQKKWNMRGSENGYLFDQENTKNRKKVLSFFGGYEKLLQSTEGSTRGYKRSNDGRVEPLLSKYEYTNSPIVVKCINIWQDAALDYLQDNRHRELTGDYREMAAGIIKFGSAPTNEDVKLFSFFYNIDGDKRYYTAQKSVFQYGIKELVYAFANSPWKTGFMKSLMKVPFPYYRIYEMIKR